MNDKIKGWGSKAAMAGALGLSLLSGGCFEEYGSAVPTGDDVRLDMPGNGFRAAGERGDGYELVVETATEVNGFVTDLVQGMGVIIDELNDHRETKREGDVRVYGPFNDEEGRDASWMIKIGGDESATDYEVFVGGRGASAKAMDLVMHGDIKIDGDMRTGGMTLDFDAIERHRDVWDSDFSGSVSGAIDIRFERDVSTERKSVEIEFIDFREEALLGDAWFSDETYRYRRADDGAGSFHLAVSGDIDDDAFVGRKVNRVQLDALWNADEQSRVRALIEDVDNEESALPHGNLELHECVDAMGGLTWRELTDEYAAEEPGYNFGEEAKCAFSREDIKVSAAAE